MLGQTLRHGQSKRRDALSRDLDRYPRRILTDFRHLSASSLRKICRYFKLEVNADGSSSKPELSRAVGRHFQKDLVVKEDAVLQNFVRFTNEFALPQSQQQKPKRYGTRSTRGSVAGGDDSDADTSGPGTGGVGQPTYCTCNRVSFGEMIGCDNDDCRIEWFHVGCVGIKPGSVKGQVWYCAECREKMDSKSVAKAKEEQRMASNAKAAATAAESKKVQKKMVKRIGPSGKKEASGKSLSVNNAKHATGNNISNGSTSNKRKKAAAGSSSNGASAGDIKSKKQRTDEDVSSDGSDRATGRTSASDELVDLIGRSTLTYSEMITQALAIFPKHTASFKDICDKMEEKFCDYLNWKPESEIRKSPVWKSSVRKILLSHQRFQKADSSNYTLLP